MATKVINSLTFGDTYVLTTPYATCSTAAGTAAKVATITPGSNFALETGTRIAVKFTNALSVAAPTLNVNSSGAKSIYFRGATLTSAHYWAAGSTVDFVFDGTYWQMLGAQHNNTYSLSSFGITASATELNYTDGVTSNIQTQLDNKLSLSGGTLSGDLILSATNVDRYVWFNHSNTNARWRVGVEGSGSGNANYFVIESDKNTTNGALEKALYIGMETLDATFGGNVTASSFIGNLTGNAATATNVNWSGVTDKPTYYDAKAITSISRSGTTFTATYLDGTTATFSQQDSDTYGRSANTTSKIYLMGTTSQSASNKTSYSNVSCYASGGYLYSGGTKVSVEGHTHTDNNSAHSHTAGTGLTVSGSGGTSGTTTYSANLNSTTSLGTIGTTSKLYAVGVDANGKLCVNVPWTDNNTNTAHTHTAGDGISLSGSGGTSGTTTISLAASGVTASSYGPSANASPAHSGTFSVPYITVDTYGRVTSASTKTITLPASGNTDTKVTQAAVITTAGSYPVMLGYSTATTSVTNTLNKSSKLLFNPSTGALSIGTSGTEGSGSITLEGSLTMGSNQSDSQGIMPRASNWNSLGMYNKYWYRAYVSTVYCGSIKTLSGGTFSFPATITWNTF